jgi:short-subunit dehydrogenase
MLKNQKTLITGVEKRIGGEIFFEALKAEAHVIDITRNQKDIKNLYQFKGKYKLFYNEMISKFLYKD